MSPLDKQRISRKRLHQVAEQVADYREVRIRVHGWQGATTAGRAQLAALHRDLYQDSYSNAGQPRRKDLQLLNQRMSRVEALTGAMPATPPGQTLTPAGRQHAVRLLAEIYADIVTAQPFDHGNERVARLFTEQVAARSGLYLNLDQVQTVELRQEIAHSRPVPGQPPIITDRLERLIDQATSTTQRYDQALHAKAH